MTSIYDENGKIIPCTIIETGPCVVTQLKTEDVDGYSSVQLAFGEQKEKNAGQPMLGHVKKANTTAKKKFVEFDNDFSNELNLGDTLLVDAVFTEGDFVDVVGTSKGKGFQGVVKRHGFGGVGQSTHGQHNRQRHPGSIGAGSTPSRVFKGMRMAGRMGGERVKVQNLRVVKVDTAKNLLLLRGAVPGHKNSYVIIEK